MPCSKHTYSVGMLVFGPAFIHVNKTPKHTLGICSLFGYHSSEDLSVHSLNFLWVNIVYPFMEVLCKQFHKSLNHLHDL